MTPDRTTPLTPDEAAAALAEHRRRESQTLTAGTSPWAARHVVPVALALPALGYLIDVDLVWLFAVMVALLAGVVVRRRVQLRTEHRSWRHDLTLLGAGLVALAANVGVQAVVRAEQLPLPNTWGAAATAVVVLALVWPLQRRGAARVRP